MSVGPLLIPSVAFYIFALGLLWWIALRISITKWVARQKIWDISWRGFVIGVVVARVVFVIRFHDAFDSSWAWFDVRDGGFDTEVGAIAGIGYVLVQLLKRKRIFTASLRAVFITLLASIPLLLIDPFAAKAEQLPELTLREINGNQVALSNFAGKPLVVNLWASWCPPCRREMPAFADAQQRYRNVHFVFINQGEQHDVVYEFLQQINVQLDNVLLDPFSSAATPFGAIGMPTTLFYNAQGQLVGKRVGGLSHASLESHLQTLTSKPAS